MTSLAAENLGIRNRGLIRQGYFADLVLFDPAKVTDRSTFESPQSLSIGIHTVWVNGRIVFDKVAPINAYPGRPLKSPKSGG